MKTVFTKIISFFKETVTRTRRGVKSGCQALKRKRKAFFRRFNNPEAKVFFWVRRRIITREGTTFILILLTFTVIIYLEIFAGFRIYGGDDPGGSHRLYFFSAMLETLATVFALTVTLLFVASQLAASAYSVRLIRLQFFSIHFIGTSISYFVTIIFLIVVFSNFRPCNISGWACAEIVTLAGIWCFAILIPFFIYSAKLMMPRFLVLTLCNKIYASDFDGLEYKKNRDRLADKIQPIFDIAGNAARRRDMRTVELVFDNVRRRFGTVIRKTTSRGRSFAIATEVFSRIRKFGFYAIENGYWDIVTDVLDTTAELLTDYGAAVRREAGRDVVYPYVKELWAEIESSGIEESNPRIFSYLKEARNNCRHSALSLL